MPRRKTMRRIKECYRLLYEAGMNQIQIARELIIGRSTVWDYLKKFKESGLTWEEVSSWSEEELDGKLFARPGPPAGRVLPDFKYIHKELRRPVVTSQLLWEEYRRENSDEYGYSRFYVLYREWCKKLKSYIRQPHVGGEKVFADYQGKKPCISPTIHLSCIMRVLRTPLSATKNSMYSPSGKMLRYKPYVSCHRNK